MKVKCRGITLSSFTMSCIPGPYKGFLLRAGVFIPKCRQPHLNQNGEFICWFAKGCGTKYHLKFGFDKTVISIDPFCLSKYFCTIHCSVLNSVECYNPMNDSWFYVKSMSEPRLGAAASLCSGKLFIAGGYGDIISKTAGSHVLDTVECFDPRSNR